MARVQSLVKIIYYVSQNSILLEFITKGIKKAMHTKDIIIYSIPSKLEY